MSRKVVITAGLVAISSVYLLTVKRTVASVSFEEIFASLLGVITLIAAIFVIVTAIHSLCRRQSPMIALLCIGFCSLPLVRLTKDLNKVPEAEQWMNWNALASRLTPLLVNYEALHPERFHELADDSEEVRIDGFAEFALAADSALRSGKGKVGLYLANPWGEPLSFVKSRGDDEKISFGGNPYPITYLPLENGAENSKGLGIARPDPKGFDAYPAGYPRVLVLMNRPSGQKK